MSCQNWKIKSNSEILCSCSSWKKHIESYSLRAWPVHCSVKGCDYSPIEGVPVMNHHIEGDKVIPVCEFCAMRTGYFDIKGSVSLINIKRHECRVKYRELGGIDLA